MPSKEWTRRFEDPASNKQRWYCVCCKCKYVTKFGMLVEVHYKGISTFLLAEVPNHDVDDVRAMFHEDTLAPTSPKDLYEKLPVLLPMDPLEVLRPATQSEVTKENVDYKKNMKLLHPDKLKEVPKWNWDKIFKLTKGKVEPQK